MVEQAELRCPAGVAGAGKRPKGVEQAALRRCPAELGRAELSSADPSPGSWGGTKGAEGAEALEPGYISSKYLHLQAWALQRVEKQVPLLASGRERASRAVWRVTVAVLPFHSRF